MEACGSDSRYVRPVNEHERSIGAGGSSDGIERYPCSPNYLAAIRALLDHLTNIADVGGTTPKAACLLLQRAW